MKNLRLKFLLFIYQVSQKHYRLIFKRKKRKWVFTEEQLLLFKDDSLGKTLGEFYKKHGFQNLYLTNEYSLYPLLLIDIFYA